MRKFIGMEYNNLVVDGGAPDLTSLLPGDGLVIFDDTNSVVALPSSEAVLQDQANVPTDARSSLEVATIDAAPIASDEAIDPGLPGEDTFPADLIFVIDPIEISPDTPDFIIDEPLDLVEIIDDGSGGNIVDETIPPDADEIVIDPVIVIDDPIDQTDVLPDDGAIGEVVDDYTIPTETIDESFPDVFIDDGFVLGDPAICPSYIGEDANKFIEPGIMIPDLFAITLYEDLTGATTDESVVGEVTEGNIYGEVLDENGVLDGAGDVYFPFDPIELGIPDLYVEFEGQEPIVDETIDVSIGDDGLTLVDHDTFEASEPTEPVFDIAIIEEPVNYVINDDFVVSTGEAILTGLIDMNDQNIEIIDNSNVDTGEVEFIDAVIDCGIDYVTLVGVPCVLITADMIL